MGFGDLNVSMQMRDTIEKLVSSAVDRMRPPYRYGIVQTVDYAASKATVIMTGDSNAVTVNYGVITPYVGATVRVNGQGTDRYIEDVVGGGLSSLPSGANLDTYIREGSFSIDTVALANTILNLPVPPIPAVAPNMALNSKCLSTQVLTTIANNATYHTVTHGAAGLTATPAGTTTADSVVPAGSPLGNGMVASVYNMDGLSNVAGARRVTMNVYAYSTLATTFEYRTQASSAWLPLPRAVWTSISWDASAGAHMVLEVRRTGGATVLAGDGIYLTDVVSTYGIGTLRAASLGRLDVKLTPTRVIQEFTAVLSIGTTRKATFQRLRGGGGTWGPWVLQDPPFTVGTDADMDLIAKLLGASSYSPVRVTRSDIRNRQHIYTTFNGDTWYGEANTYLVARNWQVPTLASGFGHYPTAYIPGRYRRLSNGMVLLRGLLSAGSGVTATNPVLLTLPIGYRPANKLMFIVGAGIAGGNVNGGARIDVLPTGEVMMTGVTSGTVVNHVALNGIQFPAAEVAPNDAWTTMPMLNSFYSYSDNTPGDRTWPTVSYWVDSVGRYWTRGLVGRATAPTTDLEYGQLPLAAATSKQIHFASMASGGFGANHYNATGQTAKLTWKAGSTGALWFHTPNFPIVPDAVAPDAVWQGYALVNSWTNYGGGTTFPPGSIWEAPDGILHNRGLITGPALGVFTSSIGTSYQASPDGIQLTAAIANNAFARIDVTNTTLSENVGSTAWLSLENLLYLREG